MSKPTTVTCRLDEIRVDAGTQPRAGLNESVVSEYTQAMLSGDEFPRMVCFWDGSARYLVEGFHRYFGHKGAGAVEVEVDQYNGTRRDAVLYAAGTNATHGLRRSDDDKRQAVRMLLQDEEWSQWADREIARRTRTSPSLVGRVRAELTAHLSTKTDTNLTAPTTPMVRKFTRGGKEHEQRVEKRAPAEPAEPVRNVSVHGGQTQLEDDDGPTVDQLLAEMQEDLRRAESRTAELEKALTDGGKEQVVSLMRQLDHATRRQGEIQEDAAKLKQARDFYERQLARCGKAVGQRDLDKVAAAVEAFVRHAKVAA